MSDQGRDLLACIDRLEAELRNMNEQIDLAQSLYDLLSIHATCYEVQLNELLRGIKLTRAQHTH